MPKINKILALVFFTLFCAPLVAQTDADIFEGKPIQKEVDFTETNIPFERVGNYIVLKITFQGFLELRFLYDTGAEHTILSKKEIAVLLNMRFDRTIDIIGTDLHTPIKAYIARHVLMQMTGFRVRKDILVLEEDIFQFDKFIGLNIHGILGAETFKNYIVKIDYTRQVLSIATPKAFNRRSLRGFDSLKIDIFRSKPYIKTEVRTTGDTVSKLNLLLDTGAGLPLLLYSRSTPGLNTPAKTLASTIGSGLGGSILGFIGRIENLKFGNFEIAKPISYFQEIENLNDTMLIMGKNGILGNDILARFVVVIDFVRQKLYLKKDKSFNEAFVFDRSGMSVIAAGTNLDRYFINEILPNAPAAESGLQTNDEIVGIGWFPSSFYTLSTINRILQGRKGATVHFTILRLGRRLKFKIKLRDLI